MAYQRIYGGKLTVYSNLDQTNSPQFEKSMTLSAFQDELSTTRDSVEINTFKQTRPQYVVFVFIRQPNDYTKFVRDLNAFSELIDGKTRSREFVAYFESLLQCGLTIDGSSVVSLMTTSSLVAILKVLISISTKSNAVCEKLTTITIRFSQIGRYFVTQWCRLFSRFINVTHLDISHNFIPSDEYVFNINEPSMKDIIGTCFQWPPRLRYLNLDRNDISYLSCELLRRLPDTLEVLYLAGNQLSAIGPFSPEEHGVNHYLPNLHTISFNFNVRLTFIDPAFFAASKAILKLCCVKNCNLHQGNLPQLLQVAKQMNFTIVV
ncbi:hypothetical protein PSN45_002380 [Yamadazyma tenuis]|nr:hypothetical protein PSN45_002380 [Yamadazyma tenuis]